MVTCWSTIESVCYVAKDYLLVVVCARFQDRVSEIRTQEISDGKVKILCDYKGALTRSVIYNDRPTTRHPNFDLLWAIFDLCDDIPIKLTWEHMKAHQDDAGLSHPLHNMRS